MDKCVTCSGEFVQSVKGAKRKHCSVPCRRKSAKRAADERGGVRQRSCESCGQLFEYLIARGADRRFCSDASCRATRLRTLAGGKPLCVTEGCGNSRGYKSGLCNSCYYRLKRTGTLARREYAYRSMHSRGYVVLATDDHPLSVNGRLMEHRKVLYDVIGNGPHPCHWCANPVNWARGANMKALVPDHLDANKSNNNISNLVASCAMCNSRRGMLMLWVRDHKDDPILWQMYLEAKAKAG